MLHVSIGAHRQVIFVPSSTNLDKNRAKLSIGWSSSTDCMKICIACSQVGQMLFAGNKYLLLKRITVRRMAKDKCIVSMCLDECKYVIKI